MEHLTSEDLIKIAQEIKIVRARLDVIDVIIYEATLKRKRDEFDINDGYPVRT